MMKWDQNAEFNSDDISFEALELKPFFLII